MVQGHSVIDNTTKHLPIGTKIFLQSIKDALHTYDELYQQEV